MDTDNLTTYGPIENIEPGRWRFPQMMNTDTFGTITVKAPTEDAAYACVIELVAKDAACRKIG